ncbi:MAG: response regulator transcription factor [Lachnospiraceae bacterium]|nr:response regulator transcription factor [Lachnospiraceae bacterium]MDE7204037.1 response regulator transcription factor [Lachnospiraceae bacterium]
MKNIFVVDDDINIGNMLEELLSREGYRVTRAYSGTEALLVLSSAHPDLVLLDLMLPGLDGKELLPRLNGIPVIVVSAKVGVEDKVDLLLGGAADYVTKPFDTKELLARIAVQLRNAAAAGVGMRLEYGDIVMDSSTHSVHVCGQSVRLTRTEYAILKLLLQNPSQVVTKTLLLDKISEETPDCMESSLRVHISNLRKKLRDIGEKDYIESVWGIGFKMNEN